MYCDVYSNIFCIFVKIIQMIRYTIKLTRSEVEELMSIINKGSHTSLTFRTAYILLNCDEGKYSPKVTNNLNLLI